MARVKSDELKSYFNEAKSWNADRVRSAMRSRNLAWIVAGTSSVLAIASVAAVAALSPLKSVEPFVIRVNDTTGAVDVATALTGTDNVTYNEAVSKFFIGQYVRAREGFNAPAAKENFDQVAVLSTPKMQSDWTTFYSRSNPNSPQNLYANAAVGIDIRSITFINSQVANVRFRRTIATAQASASEDLIATVNFGYSKAPMAESARLKNPLGFQVSSYRSDPEVSQ